MKTKMKPAKVTTKAVTPKEKPVFKKGGKKC